MRRVPMHRILHCLEFVWVARRCVLPAAVLWVELQTMVGEATEG